MRGIVIPAVHDDPIREVEVDAEDWRSLAAAIDSEYIELVRIRDPQHYLLVDETGLLTDKLMNTRAAVLYPGPTGLRGDVLVMGWDSEATWRDESELCPATIPLDGMTDWLRAWSA